MLDRASLLKDVEANSTRRVRGGCDVMAGGRDHPLAPASTLDPHVIKLQPQGSSHITPPTAA